MADDYEDDDLDEVEGNEPPAEEEGGAAAPPPPSNRNFLLALGGLGAIFLLLIIALAYLFLSRRGAADRGITANINATNQVIYAANTQTAGAATQVAMLQLTPSATLPPTQTLVPPTATNTSVVALPTATNTTGPGAVALFTATSSPTPKSTGTVPALLTQAAGQTRTQAANLTATATRLPKSGFAEDFGLPGLFGLAFGLLVVIVLVRRLRLSTNSP